MSSPYGNPWTAVMYVQVAASTAAACTASASNAKDRGTSGASDMAVLLCRAGDRSARGLGVALSCGIDFGTSNTSVHLVRDGVLEAVPVDSGSRIAETIPTLLFWGTGETPPR